MVKNKLKRYLVDSSVIVALYYSDDNQHTKAIELIKKLIPEKSSFFVHPLVFVESLTVLKKVLNRQGLESVKNDLLNPIIFDVFPNKYDPRVNRETCDYFLQENKISFTDAELLAVANNNLLTLLTFDKELIRLYRNSQ